MQYRITAREGKIITPVQKRVVENRGCDVPKRREEILAAGEKISFVERGH